MDHLWERSIPFYPVDAATASLLLHQFDATAKLEQMQELTEGKRNTNIRLHTSARDYVLRIYPPGDESWRKEANIRSLLQGEVPLQRLYYRGQHEAIGNRHFGIYEFVNGQTLLEAMRSGYKPQERVLFRLGETLAAIHKFRYPQVGFLNGQLEMAEALTPLDTWYGYFLNANVGRRLGSGLVHRIERLIVRFKQRLEDMDEQVSFVHGDFRPTNLLISEGQVTCILDWEFAMAGHSIADIGQLFRYGHQFGQAHKQAFVQAYNEYSAWTLPADWEDQGKLRDLINLLQMLGAEEELPVKFADLTTLIEGNVARLEAI